MNRLLFPIICLLLLLPIAALAASIQLPQSGQTTVYSTADDGDVRAGKAWPNPRFSSNADQTVIDNLTGLVWTRDANLVHNRDPGFDMDGAGGDGAVSWQHALDYIHKLNHEKYLGYSDWRLPNLNELASLVNQGEVCAFGWLNGQGFVGGEPLPYWSSSSNVLSAATAWTIGMADGSLNYLKKSCNGYIWPVRGGQSGGAALSGVNLPRTGQVACFDSNGATISCAGTGQDGELQIGAAWPQPRFSDNGDQTVTDNLTGLVWTRDSNLMITRDPSFDSDGGNADGAVTWQGALDYLKILNQEQYLGYSDWRLPNRIELASVMNNPEANPFAWFNWQGIFNIRDNYWTSATVASVTNNAWKVNTTGNIVGESKTANANNGFVWPVRSVGVKSLNPSTPNESLNTFHANSVTSTIIGVLAAVLRVSTDSLPASTVGASYSQTLAATGGKTAYTWSITSGALPTGLTLAVSTGKISGTPTATGARSITVQVKDANKTTATKALTITVYALPSITTASLPPGTIGAAYNQTLTVSGGKASFTWSKSSGSLPAGLTLNASSGLISGIPTTAGTSSVTFKVTDANAKSATKALSITVNVKPPSITTATLADGYKGMAYSQTLTATNGKTAYSWYITSGALPTGLTLAASTGRISGTPTATGARSITVQVKDANKTTATKALTITVYALPSITTASLQAGTIGAIYSRTLAVSGGKASFIWSKSSGNLPAGLTLNSTTGVISSKPTTVVSSSVTFKVTDANAKTATKAFSIIIKPSPPSITTTTLADGYFWTFYDNFYGKQLVATGGKTPYTWSSIAGALPAGLSLSSTGVISGISKTEGISSFTIQVKDSNNATATVKLSLTILPALEFTCQTVLPSGAVGGAYNQTLSVSGGKMPYNNWRISGGTLPNGLSLNTSTGVITGTPTVSGLSNFLVQVSDANNMTREGNFYLTICDPVNITTSTLHNSFIGSDYSKLMSATDGLPPYTWSISDGALPPGLVLDPSTGLISGTPSVINTNTMTIQARDSNNVVATKVFSLTVNGFGSIAGTVSDQISGAPIQGAKVTLNLSYKDNNSNDKAYSCHDTPFSAVDYSKVESDDEIKTSCHFNSSFKIRNPFGVPDPFTMQWKGLSTHSDQEYLAQSFKPTKTGSLNRVSFYLTGYTAIYPAEASVYVLLKSSLGGDCGIYLAHSAELAVLTSAAPGWYDFDFVKPVTVTAGQEYFIELQGSFPSRGSMCYLFYDSASWDTGVQYSDGKSYQRIGGVWGELNKSLAFRTYVDTNSDILNPLNPLKPLSIGGVGIHGSARSAPEIYLEIPGTNLEDRCYIGCAYSNEFYTYENNANCNCTKIVSKGSDYYDQNGWITAVLYSSMAEESGTATVTDQFSITFNRTLTAVTDVNGAYSFPDLPDGNYTVTYGGTTTSSGALNPGQQLNIDAQLPSLPPMTINIISPSDRTLVNSSGTITVTGSINATYPVSINGVQATVSNNSFSAYISLTQGLNTITATATNLYGQTASSSITVIYNSTPRIVAAPATVDFGAVRNGNSATLNITLSNTSAANLSLGIITRLPAPFWILSENCSGTTLLPSASCHISTQFIPTAPGTFTSELTVPLDEAIQQHLVVALKGTAVDNGYFLPDTGQVGEPVRNPISYTLNSINIATDDNTKLMWQRNAAVAAMNWANADSYCNNLSIDGLSGWRLPNLVELISIQNYGVFDPTIDRTVFPLTNSGNYWTSVSIEYPSPNAKTVNFLYGESELTNKTATAFVRCVQGTELVASAYFSGDMLTLHDENTGITMLNYFNALDNDWNHLPALCSGMTGYGGYNDWRVPTIKERTLFNQFGWSSTSSYNGNLSKALVYSSERIDSVSKTSKDSYGLRCVRGGNLYSTINGLTVSDIGMNAATIQWVTNRPATGVVEYGETSDYGSSVTDTNLMVQHAITLDSLKPATTYHYRAVSNTQGIFIYSADQTFTTPASIVKSLGDTGNITLMEISANYDVKNPDGSDNDIPRQEVAKEYIRTHGDTFDFLVFLSTFDYAMPEASAKGYYLPVKNDTQGINRPLIDNSARFGSQGKLQGTIDLGNATQLAGNLYGPKLDETLTILSHELMHRFGAYIRFKNRDGSLNSALLGRDSAHWSYLLDSKGSLMYGNGWQENTTNGTFTSGATMTNYSPLDLYLMGMIPKEQVPPMLLIDNPAIDKTQLPQLGATITGTSKMVTIDDIIAAEGARIPDATTSQKKFNVGFVLLTRAGDNATAATQAIETLRKAWAGRFAELTQGKATVGNVPPTLELAVDSLADGATITGPDVTVSGTVINTTGAETGITVNGIPATVSGNGFIVNHVPLQQGNNSIEIKATDANGLTATATRNVTASPGNYIRITSNIESGTAPLNLSFRLEGSFSIDNPVIRAAGPVPPQVTAGSSSTEFTANLTIEGTYTFTASAVGPDGQRYTDSVMVTVINQEKIDNLMRAKWSSINTQLSNGNIASALTYFHPIAKDKYEAIFDEVKTQLPVILATHRELSLVRVRAGIVQYELTAFQDNTLFTYDIVFVLDDNGLWRIRSY